MSRLRSFPEVVPRSVGEKLRKRSIVMFPKIIYQFLRLLPRFAGRALGTDRFLILWSDRPTSRNYLDSSGQSYRPPTELKDGIQQGQLTHGSWHDDDMDQLWIQPGSEYLPDLITNVESITEEPFSNALPQVNCGFPL